MRTLLSCRTVLFATVCVVASVAVVASAKIKKHRMTSLEIVQNVVSCADDVRKGIPNAPPHYYDKVCGCLADEIRNTYRRTGKFVPANDKTHKVCHKFAFKNKKVQKPLRSPKTGALKWGSERITAGVAGCMQRGSKANPNLPQDQMLNMCTCLSDSFRAKKKLITAAATFDQITDADTRRCARNLKKKRK